MLNFANQAKFARHAPPANRAKTNFKTVHRRSTATPCPARAVRRAVKCHELALYASIVEPAPPVGPPSKHPLKRRIGHSEIARQTRDARPITMRSARATASGRPPVAQPLAIGWIGEQRAQLIRRMIIPHVALISSMRRSKPALAHVPPRQVQRLRIDVHAGDPQLVAVMGMKVLRRLGAHRPQPRTPRNTATAPWQTCAPAPARVRRQS